MQLLKVTTERAFNTEDEAKQEIESCIEKANQNGSTIVAAGYKYKSKKSKGEIVDERWVTSITETFEDLWG